MRSLASSALALLLAATPALAQQEILARAMDFERQGRNAEAATAFKQLLQRDPLSAPALLGAERVLTQLNQRDTILALVRRTLQVDSAHTIARIIEVRTARVVGGEQAAADALRRWMAAAPMSEGPYRELVRVLLSAGRRDEAREAVMTARTRLNDSARLRPELAQVEQALGNWPAAAREWRAELLRRPDVNAAAVFNLSPAPVASREALLRALTPDTTAAPRRLAAELLLGWNEPAQAWRMMQSALPAGREDRATALRGFADRARAREGAESQRVAAAALEQLAASVGPAEAARFRIESARAFADAGDPAAARRVLRAMADDPTAPAGIGQNATATLVELYVREGNPEEAARLLERNRSRLGGSETDRLNLTVARGWIARGDLERAERTVGADSSLAGDEIRGWIALYRGEGGRAGDLLRGATPRPGDRLRPADRAALVALLQALETDSTPDLGRALYAAARGDTASAARSLLDLARRSTGKGKPELLAYTARFLEAARDSTGAHSLWTELADQHAASAPAPAALLALARTQASRGDVAGAVQRLEHLILQHPGSALLPEARRELDRVRGLVPRSE